MGIGDYKARVLDEHHDSNSYRLLFLKALRDDPRIKVCGTCGDCARGEETHPNDGRLMVKCGRYQILKERDGYCDKWQAREGA